MNRVVGAFGPIVLFQTFSKSVRRYSDDCVDLGIEIRGAPQGVNGDVVFLDFVRESLEVLLANKAQDSGRMTAAAEDLRIEQQIQLSAFGSEFLNRGFHGLRP